jgi:hypothetical protein
MEQRLTSLRRKFSNTHIKIKIIPVMIQYPLINLQKNTHIKIQRIIQPPIQGIVIIIYQKQINIPHHIANL